MNKKPYLVDAIIGNSKLLASLNKDGEIVRFWWPQITYPDHIDISYGGVFIENAGETIWTNNIKLKKEQRYVENTNILLTNFISEENEFKIELKDFAIQGRDTAVRNYRIYNTASTERNFKFLYYTSFQGNGTKLCSSMKFDYNEDALVYFKHEYSLAIGSLEKVYQFTTGDSLNDAKDGVLNGIYESTGSDGCLSFDLGDIKPGAFKEVTLLISAGKGNEEALNELGNVKRKSYRDIYCDTESYWLDYLKCGKVINIKNKKVEDVYKRSLLAFKLLTDDKHGSIAAAPEVDEEFERCGGYGFCWGRDAAYICSAFDEAGYTDMSENFFKWAKRVQEKDGSWNQRYHIDGCLAPVWGLQIDETGAIVWGIYKHYGYTKSIEFLNEMSDTVFKASEFLMNFIDKETGLPKPSMDLWEERKGEHIYSAASVYGGLIGAGNIAKELDKTMLSDSYFKAAEKLKKAILEKGWSEENNTFFRSIKREIDEKTYDRLLKNGEKVVSEEGEKGYIKYYQWEDNIIDICLLGICEPFEVLASSDIRVQSTAAKIEKRLLSPKVGGFKRYEDDIYIGGNPWILTTLWLALYKAREKKYDEALNLLEWAADHSTELGLLPEQIDKETGKTAWINPLTWSHAMFVLTVIKLYQDGKLNN